jgi:fibronectin-binding autotransporter adhesin
MFATTALAGLGGVVGTVVLSPGAALAAECTPATPDAGMAGPASATIASSQTENCGPEFSNTYGTGLAYVAGSGNLTVTVGGVGNITPNGVYLNGVAQHANLTYLTDTTTTAGPTIVTTSGSGIILDTTAGNILISTGNTTAAGNSTTGGPFPATNPQAGSVVDGHDYGIGARTTGSGTVTINAAGNVTGETNDGIRVSAQNGNVSILASGNGDAQIQSNSALNSAGIRVDTTGGNVTIITDQGDNVASLHGDGIDVTSQTGNIFVHLLDGAINANTSGVLAASGVTGAFPPTPSGVSGVSAPVVGPGINLVTGGNGTIVIITDDNVNNKGPGDGIDTRTQNGLNSVTVDAQVNNTKGNGVLVTTTGNGLAQVILGNVTSGNTSTPYLVDTTGNGGGAVVGVGARNFAATGNQTAEVISTDPGNITVGNATAGSTGIFALVTGNGLGSIANVTMVGGSGGLVSVQGTKNDNTGIEARDDRGTATVTTNTGRTILVGQLSGNGDVGVEARGNLASVTLGASNTITVGNGTGNTTSFGEVGVESRGGASSSVTIGNGTSVTVNGLNGNRGVEAFSFGSTSINVANAGAGIGIVVNGNATGNATIGVLAAGFGNATVGIANITIGSTAVKVTGGTGAIGLEGFATAGVNITTAGNVSSTGVGIRTFSGGSTTINVNGGTTSGLGATVANIAVPVIEFTNRTANTTTTVGIGAAGTVEATGASLTGLAISPGPGAANLTYGSVVVNDAGHLIGDVDFSSMVGTGFAGNATLPANITNTAVNVTGNGVWLTSGTSKFGNGALGAGNLSVASDSVSTGRDGGDDDLRLRNHHQEQLHQHRQHGGG